MSRMVRTIRCDNTEEYEKLAPMLSTRGYRWESGEDPMEWNPYSREPKNAKCYINLYSNYIIRYDDKDNYMDAISVTEYRIKEGLTVDKFTKADLQDGMIMKLRDGRCYMYFKKCNRGVRYEGFIPIDDYNDDLTYNGSCCGSCDSAYDIVAVYSPETLTTLDVASQIKYSNLIWKRPKEVVMTIAEIEKKLGITNLKIVKGEDE